MKRNKFINSALSVLLACSFLFSSFPFVAKAETPKVRTESGKISFEITSTAATSSIKYRTRIRRPSSAAIQEAANMFHFWISKCGR